MAITAITGVPPAPESQGSQTRKTSEMPKSAPGADERLANATPRTDHVTLHDSTLEPSVDERFEQARQGEIVEIDHEPPTLTPDLAVREAQVLFGEITSSSTDALAAQGKIEIELAQKLMSQAVWL